MEPTSVAAVALNVIYAMVIVVALGLPRSLASSTKKDTTIQEPWERLARRRR